MDEQKRKIILISGSVILAVLVIGIYIGRHSMESPATEKAPLYWVDSMEPTVHYPAPGKSRMGMELTPVYPDGDQTPDAEGTVRISPAVVNNLGVRIVPVMQGPLAKQIESVGYIEPNENKISHIHSYTDGWIKKLFVKATGEPIKKDQSLLLIYSPMLVNAQEEYLIAIESGDKSLADASIKKMQALHISEQQIQQLVKTKKSSQLVDIYSPQDGYIAALNVREGMRVTPDTEMMSLVDLSNIWMIAQVFEEQANWIKVGETAEARISSSPDKVWEGEVEYIYPQIDPTTRTLKVRFRFNNPDNILKPNMYANITLQGDPKSNVLSIPSEALLRSSQDDRVIVSLGNGRFQARSVKVGIESGDRVEILSGLKVGENVVASGQFLIDSETNLKTGLERFNQSPQATDKQQAPSPSASVFEGNGIIKSINISDRTLTLQHEAMPALNWPEMVMDFVANQSIDLSQFKIGNHVQFLLKKTVDNRYEITEMKEMSH